MSQPRRSAAFVQAFLVAFLWSRSVILVVLEIDNIPALTFAGLRGMIAFLALLPLALRQTLRRQASRLSTHDWALLALLGLLQYAVTQGAQFVSLAFLPAATVGLVLGFAPVVVAISGTFLLAEHPTRRQWVGLVVCLLGVLAYFYPPELPAGQRFGLLIAGVGLLGAAGSNLVGRAVNKDGHLSPVLVTTISMGVGALIVLTVGLLTQGLPSLNLRSWGVVLWLGLASTALANTLLNASFRALSAMEVSIILNTMLIQIAAMAWIVLGQRLTVVEMLGLPVVAIGTVFVQVRRKAPDPGRAQAGV